MEPALSSVDKSRTAVHLKMELIISESHPVGWIGHFGGP